MPLYDYDCPNCGAFALMRSMDDRDRAARCPACRRAVQRQVSAPNLALMPSARRQAHFRNEKSAHEPMVCAPSHRCNTQCGCSAKPGAKLRGSTRTVDLGRACPPGERGLKGLDGNAVFGNGWRVNLERRPQIEPL